LNSKLTLSSLMTEKEARCFREFVYELNLQRTKHLLRNEIVLRFNQFLDQRNSGNKDPDDTSKLEGFFSRTQEMLLLEEDVVLLYRSEAAHYRFFRIHNVEDRVDELMAEEFLDYREIVADRAHVPPEKKLLIDFQPFYSIGPEVPAPKKIGNGHRYLNSYMAGKLQDEPEDWQAFLFVFLKIHSINNDRILVDGEIIEGPAALVEALQKAIDLLEGLDEEAPIQIARASLNSLGIREGFGNTVGRTLTHLQLLSNLFESPSADYLDEFIGAIPLVSRVAVISPHGWFGQDHVLGRPDTGGQVVYILDQVKALETYLKNSLASAGLSVPPKIIVVTRLIPENEGTTSNQRLEKINGTDHCWILRVPFKDDNQNIVPHWLSRFQVWPFLEQFALDTKNELLTEFGGKPDMIIGNYSDGNLVASLLASWLQVIQCNIAHALEKPKFLFSDLHWQDMEKDFNFSLQFTADLISMNKADVIVSSTSQEIAGTDTSLGQYESYCLFSMPELYKVTNGVNLLHPKFNVVSPGVDESIYFPYTYTSRRLKNQTEQLSERLFFKKGDDIFGELEHPDKTPIFTIARLDKIKNLTGLVESFGQSKDLQRRTNLIIVTNTIREEKVTDAEEMSELKKMYQLIDEYELQNKIRWIENSSRKDGAESYRIMADRRGVFVQPALFEAFGLTVLEGMATGLPVFATQFGGPQEIIEDGKNGYLINPTQPELISQPILDFLLRCEKNPSCWETLGGQAIIRVKERFSWDLYSEKLIKAAKLYGFWNYSVLGDEKKEVDRYCNLLFHMVFKNRARQLLGD
jgi:sucrose synthase